MRFTFCTPTHHHLPFRWRPSILRAPDFRATVNQRYDGESANAVSLRKCLIFIVSTALPKIVQDRADGRCFIFGYHVFNHSPP